GEGERRGSGSFAAPNRRGCAPSPAVKPIPDGYPTLAAYLIVGDGAAAIAFYQQVFGAKLRLKLGAPGGKIGHAELEIGDSLIMLADEHPEIGALSPKSVGGSPIGLPLYVEDVDAVTAGAAESGGAPPPTPPSPILLDP